MVDKPPFTEAIPSVAGAISALASANAPFIYFDGAPNYAFANGIVSVTLEALRHTPAGDNILVDRVSVAHLRMSAPAAIALRHALDAALKLVDPSVDFTKVN